MSDKPFAYQRWCCSECDSEPISERNGDADLRCETCGHLFRIGMGGHAEYVPDPEDDDEDPEESDHGTTAEAAARVHYLNGGEPT